MVYITKDTEGEHRRRLWLGFTYLSEVLECLKLLGLHKGVQSQAPTNPIGDH